MSIAENLAQVQARIAAAARAAGRDPAAVRLLVATKTQSPERIREVLDQGARLIGENRVQEITAKYEALRPYPHELHMIGYLQRNKVKALVGRVACVQSLDRLELAQSLQRHWEAAGATLSVLLEVNTSGEAAKHGVAPEKLGALLDEVRRMECLKIRGFMTVGAHSEHPEQVRAGFRQLRTLRTAAEDRLGFALPELSMGMSGDLEAAIAEGATLLRLGTAIFGARTAH